MDSQEMRPTVWTSKQLRTVESCAGLDTNVQLQTLNVLVNNGVRVGASTLTLDSPPSGVDGMVELPELDQKHFLRELRAGKITQLCMIVAEDERSDLRSMLTSVDTEVHSSSTMDEDVLVDQEKTRAERYASQSWKALEGNPLYDILRDFEDVFPEEIPCELPKDRGIRHEIVLQPGTKYCVTRQWPLPRDQVKAIDEFFETRRRAGHVRESVSPHSSPTFCVKKATGGWRIVHAFNKLNAATIPAQTPIPRKDVIIDGMQGSTIFSALDLRDGYYQILMREQDIPLTAVSTPSGMLWEWLVMPQGLSNAPATFNRCVTHLLRSVRDFAPSYFDDVFVHSKAMNGKTDVEMHRIHVRKLLELMRKHQLYANLKKCVFAAPEIEVLGCYVSKDGVRPDPEKIRAITEWTSPRNVKELRQFLGMATYLHRYSRGFAQHALPLTALLRKDATWKWSSVEEDAFKRIKQSLIEAPILAIADQEKPFSVVCDASDNAIGCALMQKDDDARDRVIAYESRQLKPAERNYPVHDKELLAMKYALAKFRVYLLGDRPFTVYTDHASLRTAVNSPHLSQRMARWLSFFAEFNFTVEYKPGRLNVVADALSRRPDHRSTLQDGTQSVNTTSVVSTPSSPLLDDVRRAYAHDREIVALIKHLSVPTGQTEKKLTAMQRAALHRYKLDDGLLWYRALSDDEYAVVVPNDHDLKLKIMYEYHDAPVSGHRGREKTLVALRRDFYWQHQYKYVRKYVRACEVCQRAKASRGTRAPLQSLEVPKDCWKSISMDFVFGLPKDKQGRDGVLVFVDRFSKMVHFAAVPETIDAPGSAHVFIENVFRLHGMPDEIISDRDPRFTAAFWQAVFRGLGTRLKMSTSDHPETDGQTERANRVLEEILRAYAHSFESWSMHLPLVEFAINNSVHASTGLTPFYVNGLRHPRTPALLGARPQMPDAQQDVDGNPSMGDTNRSLGDPIPSTGDTDMSPDVSSNVEPAGGSTMDLSSAVTRSQARLEQGSIPVIEPLPLQDVVSTPTSTGSKPVVKRLATQVRDFTQVREAIVRFVQDAIAAATDRHKANADKNGRVNCLSFNVGDEVLLSTSNLANNVVSYGGNSKLLPRYIGPFRVVACKGQAYTLDLPSRLRTHPTFYLGRLRPYRRRHDDVSGGERLDDTRRDGQLSCPSSSSNRRLSWPVGPTSISESPASSLARDDAQFLGAGGSPAGDTRRSGDRIELDPILPPPPPPLIDSAGDQRWHLDRLVDHRDEWTKGKTPRPMRKYRVRWLGYPPSHDTWEDRAILMEDVPDEVLQYEREHPLGA
jgi:hypothetical protein